MNARVTNKPPARTFYRKRVGLFALLEKVKLWPSRTGLLHGIRVFETNGTQGRITTHCGKTFSVTDSRNSRAARWLRNKWHTGACRACAVPKWKLEKYSRTFFKRGYGSDLHASERQPGPRKG